MKYSKTCGPVTLGILALVAYAWLGGCNAHPAHTTNTKAAATQQKPADVPERMPEFDLKDTAGREVSSAQFMGKVVLLDFWATWCAPCKREMPGYENLYRRYKSRGLVVVGIAADSDPRVVSRLGRKLGITYPLLVNGMDVQRYGVEGVAYDDLGGSQWPCHKEGGRIRIHGRDRTWSTPPHLNPGSD